MLPMHQVVTHCVSPALDSREGRVMYVKHVVVAVPEDRPVRIAHLAGRRNQVISRTLRILGQFGLECQVGANSWTS